MIGHFKPGKLFIRSENGEYVEVGKVKSIEPLENVEVKQTDFVSFFNSQEISFSCNLEDAYMNRRMLHKMGFPNNLSKRLGLPLSRKNTLERRGKRNCR